jgi:hypothetical protein
LSGHGGYIEYRQLAQGAVAYAVIAVQRIPRNSAWTCDIDVVQNGWLLLRSHFQLYRPTYLNLERGSSVHRQTAATILSLIETRKRLKRKLDFEGILIKAR